MDDDTNFGMKEPIAVLQFAWLMYSGLYILRTPGCNFVQSSTMFFISFAVLSTIVLAEDKKCVSLFESKPEYFDVCRTTECFIFRTEIPVRQLTSPFVASYTVPIRTSTN